MEPLQVISDWVNKGIQKRDSHPQGYWTSLWKNTAGCLQKINQKETKIKLLLADERFTTKLRLFLKELVMAVNASNTLHPSLRPPECVKGMTSLARDSFNKTVKVPGFKLPRKQIGMTQKSWKPLLLKLRGLKPVASLDSKDPLKDTHSLILLDPAKLDDSKEKAGLVEKLERFGMSPEAIQQFELEIGYDNWSVPEIMKAILPRDADNVSSFTQVGHIAHLNLREENLAFKHLIGEVIIDKVPSVKTVVNKLNTIDNTYRNFAMELLAGENNFITQTREHNCVFELDFSKVYWNSRLSTEHHRVVDLIPKESMVYDVFAGVGPFTVPLAKKKKCTILANDLNPHSYESLERNIKLNSLKAGCVKAYNMDGRDFIRSVVKPDLVRRIEAENKRLHHSKNTEGEASANALSLDTTKDETCVPTFVVMNLPALAVDFLDAFISLFDGLNEECQNPEIMKSVLPMVYCYAFCGKSDDIEGEVKRRAESVLQQNLPPDAAVRIVRNVSPNKEMVCLSFKLWSGLVLAVNTSAEQESDEPACKMSKLS